MERKGGKRGVWKMGEARGCEEIVYEPGDGVIDGIIV
jgi:hypothetical protein